MASSSNAPNSGNISLNELSQRYLKNSVSSNDLNQWTVTEGVTETAEYKLSLSNNSAISASMSVLNVSNSQGADLLFNPEISLYTASYSENRRINLNNNARLSLANKPLRSDRYRDTIPAVFRLTLKGYSIVEYSEQRKETWSFNKVGNKALRKPEIMFSFTKQF